MSSDKTDDKDAAAPQTVTEALAQSLVPEELTAARRDSMRRRILDSIADAAPPGTLTIRQADGEWISVTPFIQAKILRIDRAAHNQTILLRMRQGGVLPGHHHQQEEEFLVLEGECHVGTHRLMQGDVHIARAGSWHDAITTRTGVMVILRGEYPAPTASAALGNTSVP